MNFTLEIVALFLLSPIAFVLHPWRGQSTASPEVRLGEAAFFALPPQVRLVLDDYSIPTTVRNGIVSVELAPDVWNLLLEVTGGRRTQVQMGRA
jgi:hypothetical protein